MLGSDLFTRTKRVSWFLYGYATIKDTCACERFMCVPLQCLNKILIYCDNLPTNYTCPPFSGPAFSVHPLLDRTPVSDINVHV